MTLPEGLTTYAQLLYRDIDPELTAQIMNDAASEIGGWEKLCEELKYTPEFDQYLVEISNQGGDVCDDEVVQHINYDALGQLMTRADAIYGPLKKRTKRGDQTDDESEAQSDGHNNKRRKKHSVRDRESTPAPEELKKKSKKNRKKRQEPEQTKEDAGILQWIKKTIMESAQLVDRVKHGKELATEHHQRATGAPIDNSKYGPNYVPPMKGEKHFPGHNFTGPGTQITWRLEHGIKPMNKVDEASMYHDIEYTDIMNKLQSHKITDQKARALVRIADQKAISAIKKLTKSEIPSDDSAFWVSNILTKKMESEDLGLIDRLKFITGAKRGAI